MRAAIAYARRGPLSAVGAASASLFFGGFVVAAFAVSNPIVLAGAAGGVAAAGLAAGARRALAMAARWSAALGVLIVAVNGLASQRGDTVLLRAGELPVLGRIDVSAEALAEGGVLALRIAIVLAAFAIHSACVDPDRLLRLVRPLARHSALTAALIARLVPLAAADYARLREAARLRGPAAAPVGRAALARRLVAGSLDRAIDVAATLELRGYARGAPARAPRPRASRHGRRFAACGAAAAALTVAIRLAGAGDFDAYPTVAIDAGPATMSAGACLALLGALPFLGLARARGRRARRSAPPPADRTAPIGAAR
jgi:energy-coupling factor transporter transmembrane protein EcfT